MLCLRWCNHLMVFIYLLDCPLSLRLRRCHNCLMVSFYLFIGFPTIALSQSLSTDEFSFIYCIFGWETGRPLRKWCGLPHPAVSEVSSYLFSGFQITARLRWCDDWDNHFQPWVLIYSLDCRSPRRLRRCDDLENHFQWKFLIYLVCHLRCEFLFTHRLRQCDDLDKYSNGEFSYIYWVADHCAF